MYCYVVFALIRLSGIEHPDIVFRQYQLESGHGTSRISTEYKNLFGMKCAKVRNTTQTGCATEWGVYSNVLESIRDYKIWQDVNGSGLSRSEYLSMLRKVYKKDKKYLQDWFK